MKTMLEAKDMDRAMVRISHEIIERNKGVSGLCVLGIQKGGVHPAHRIAGNLAAIEGVEVPVGSLDISFYRDDLMLRGRPKVSRTEIGFDLTGMKIVLVDDVLFTGRSIRAAMDALIDIGRPDVIQLAVLIDRGHRELPIRADYVGRNIPTGRDETVEVLWSEDGETDAVILMRSATDGA